MQVGQRRVHRGEVPLDDLDPRLLYVLSMAFLICASASSRGSDPEMAKKHVCMIVLMRPAMPACRATAEASIA